MVEVASPSVAVRRVIPGGVVMCRAWLFPRTQRRGG